jgi:peptidoglycan/xylan/chitin deacetylase (PgdA/CDA1 family)
MTSPWSGLIVVCLALAGCRDERSLTYPWDDRRVLCSDRVDDLVEPPRWGWIEDQMQDAEHTGSVVLLHAHTPGTTVTAAAIDRLLTMAEAHHLDLLTFRELDPGATPRPGLALAFDDDAFDAWFGLRALLVAHRAHVTFFVTRWYASSDGERAELRALADDGHDVEPHTVNHMHAPHYAREHGVAGYLADELMPSIDALTHAGYAPPAAFAFPFGRSTEELNAAVLQVVPRVRVGPASCPYGGVMDRQHGRQHGEPL